MNKQRVLQALENVKSNPYGKWGILNVEQRNFIRDLCNSWLILDEATNMQTKEIERLNNIIETYKDANEYHQNIIHELETMKQPNQLYGENVILRTENNKLNKRIKELEEGFKATTEDLCEESTKIEKAIEYIKKHTYHDKPKKLQNGIYERGILLIKSDFDIEELLEILDKGE